MHDKKSLRKKVILNKIKLLEVVGNARKGTRVMSLCRSVVMPGEKSYYCCNAAGQETTFAGMCFLYNSKINMARDNEIHPKARELLVNTANFRRYVLVV